MKRTIIAGLALALAGTAQAQERPYQHTAQCLAEIGMLTNDRLDFGDPDMVDRATRKADALMDATQRVINARANAEAATVAFIASLRRSEAEGKSPPGAADVTEEQRRQERAVTDAEDRLLIAQTPNCVWPTQPTARE